MKIYNVRIKFVAPYLQARFSEQAKEELLKDARKTVIKNATEEDEIWIRLSYFDKSGYYIPSEHLEMAMVESSKDFKMKAKRSSLKNYAKATFFVQGEKNYLGKKKPDNLMTSYPKRKDGNRVKIIHPSFLENSECDFKIECLDDDFSDRTMKDILENAGKKVGIGARRPKFGRFVLADFKRL